MMNRMAIHTLLLAFSLSIPSIVKSQDLDTVVVHFAFNQYNISDSAAVTIDDYLSSIRKKFKIKTISLSGYTDNVGGNVYNKVLAGKRVNSVKQYILDNWNDSEIVISEESFGKQFPLNDNSTAALRDLNRRVEIIFQKVKTAPAKEIPKPVEDDSQGLLYDSIMDSSTALGSNVILKNLNFYGGRHFPLPQSDFILHELLRIMKTNPKLQIEIQGHICCTIPGFDGRDIDTDSMNLSVQRAKFVYEFLVTNGIDKDRMTYVGFGSNHKLYPEERTLMEQSLNRRVEIKIINK